MAQILVRNLPDDVKSRLQRRAKRHGRSLEAEARSLLTEAPEPAPERPSEVDDGVAGRLAKKLARHRLAEEDWKAFDDSIEELRRGWNVREIDFGK